MEARGWYILWELANGAGIEWFGSRLGDGHTGQALSNLTQPFLASAIGTYFDNLERQPDGTMSHEYAPERLLAHAAAGAAIAYLSGNHAASGATGAASGEAMAMLVHDQLYGNKPTDQLTTSEKESIRAVATLAAGLVGALQGGSFETAATSAAAGYNAAVNNDTREQGAYDAPKFTWKDKAEIETKIKINQAKTLKDKIADTKVQIEGSGNLGMGAHAHGSVKATIGINHGITVDEAEAGVGAGAALKFKLGGAVVEGTPKTPSAESDIKPNETLWEKPIGSEQRERTISVGAKAAIEGDLLIFHGEASTIGGVDSKIGGNGDTSTYAGGKAEIGAKPQIGAGAAAYVDIFNWKYTGDKKDGE